MRKLMTKIDRPVRLDLMLPAELAQDMQDIENYTGLSRAEIFRRAFYFFKRLKECQMSGGTVFLREGDASIKEIVGF
jgi:hypothetical protein